MTYNITPTFKAIRYFERMTGVSFLDLDSRQDLLIHLVYCCLLAHPENNFNMTFEDALQEFFPKNAQQLIQEFSTNLAVLNQFRKASFQEDNNSTEQQDTSSPGKEEKMFMSSLIPILIMNCHLDPDFVLNQMDYTDTELYLNYSIERYHQKMEDTRFWTYLQVAPHISSKSGIKKPDDLISFTWEKEQKKHDAEERYKRERARLIELGLIKEDSSETLNKDSEG